MPVRLILMAEANSLTMAQLVDSLCLTAAVKRCVLWGVVAIQEARER